MRRKSAPKRGRVVPILLAGSVGYLLGSAHIPALRSTDLSAAESVALRFPQDWKDASVATGAAIRTAALKLRGQKSVVVASADIANADVGSANITNVMATTSDTRRALLSPQPLVPRPVSDGATQQADQDTQATMQIASAEQPDAVPAPGVSLVPQAAPSRAQAPAAKSAAVASPPAPAQKVATIAPHPRPNDRPGYMLNDTQIASIKDRLHLTPDQEEMWPAVEAALRNMAYTRAQQAHARGVPASGTQTAAVDPEAVAGLKSAAVPLIMSFNAEQKEEVRNLAHVMGLDQLASQF
jgi:hypothetical protein